MYVQARRKQLQIGGGGGGHTLIFIKWQTNFFFFLIYLFIFFFGGGGGGGAGLFVQIIWGARVPPPYSYGPDVPRIYVWRYSNYSSYFRKWNQHWLDPVDIAFLAYASTGTFLDIPNKINFNLWGS